MELDLNQLRQAVKSVLPLASESYRGTGTGVFMRLDGGMWLVTGSFNSKLAGALVGEVDPSILDKYFAVNELHQYLMASFATERVVVEVKDNRLIFKIGRNTRSFPFDSVADVSKFVKLPALSDSMEAPDMRLFQAVAAAASTDRTSDLSGVWFDGQSDIEMLALDGFLIAYARFKNKLTRNFRCLVPAEFIHFVGRMYWERTPLMTVKDEKFIVFSDRFFAISNTLVCETYRGETVAGFYRQLIFGKTGVVDTLDFIDKIGALIGVDVRDSTVSSIKFQFDDERGDLHLSAQSKLGNGEAEFYITSHGLNYQCILNGHLAKKAAGLLRNLNSPSLLFYPDPEHNLMLVKANDSDELIVGIVPMAF